MQYELTKPMFVVDGLDAVRKGVSLLHLFAGIGGMSILEIEQTESFSDLQETEKAAFTFLARATERIIREHAQFMEDSRKAAEMGNSWRSALWFAAVSLKKWRQVNLNKKIRQFEAGYQTEKRGIKIREGFRNKQEELDFDENAAQAIAAQKHELVYLYCYPTHGGSGKVQTLIRRIYQVTRAILGIDIMSLKIGGIMDIFTAIAPLAGIDTTPDKQTFRRHLKKEHRQAIDGELKRYMQRKAAEQQAGRPIEAETVFA